MERVTARCGNEGVQGRIGLDLGLFLKRSIVGEVGVGYERYVWGRWINGNREDCTATFISVVAMSLHF